VVCGCIYALFVILCFRLLDRVLLAFSAEGSSFLVSAVHRIFDRLRLIISTSALQLKLSFRESCKCTSELLVVATWEEVWQDGYCLLAVL